MRQIRRFPPRLPDPVWVPCHPLLAVRRQRSSLCPSTLVHSTPSLPCWPGRTKKSTLRPPEFDIGKDLQQIDSRYRRFPHERTTGDERAPIALGLGTSLRSVHQSSCAISTAHPVLSVRGTSQRGRTRPPATATPAPAHGYAPPGHTAPGRVGATDHRHRDGEGDQALCRASSSYSIHVRFAQRLLACSERVQLRLVPGSPAICL